MRAGSPSLDAGRLNRGNGPHSDRGGPMAQMRRLQTFPPLPSETREVRHKAALTPIAGLHRLFATIHDDPSFEQLANFRLGVAILRELIISGTSAAL